MTQIQRLSYDFKDVGMNNREFLSAFTTKEEALDNLMEHGSRILHYYPEDFTQLGLAPGRAKQLWAAIQLTRNLTAKPLGNGPISGPVDAYQLMRGTLEGLKQEHLYVVTTDAKMKPIRKHLVHVGGLATSVVEVSSIMHRAILDGAGSFFLYHNHPSGSADPSMEDIEVTERMLKASKIIGIPLNDHIIIGDNSYCSIKRKFPHLF